MAFKSYRKISRDSDWGTEGNDITLERINCGSLLRIADATEAMAKNYTELINDRKYWMRRCKNAEYDLTIEKRRSAGLRGYLARIKGKK